MAKMIPKGCQFWPEKVGSRATPDIIKMYEDGFAGAYGDPEANEQFNDTIRELNGVVEGEAIAHSVGFADSGKGQLVIPYVWPLIHFPGCLPGAGQERGDCFAKGTIAIGPDECKPIEDVVVGDRVFMADGSITEVITTQAKTSLRPMVRVNALGTMPVSVTPEHKVLVYRMGMYNEKVRNNRALAERNEKQFLDYKSTRTRSGKEFSDDKAVVAYREREAEWIRADELADGDYLLTPVSREKGVRPEHPLLDTEEGRWLIGYFLGDGCANKKTKRLVEFAVANHHEAYAEKLESVIKSLGLTSYRKPYVRKGVKSKAFAVRFSSKAIGAWLVENFYSSDGNKNLPSWAIGDRFIIQGLLDADGHKRGRVQCFDSVSPSLAYGVQASFIEWGIDATIGKFHRSKGSYPTSKIAYRVIARTSKQKKMIWRDDEYVCFPVTSTERIEGPHVVYDIGVEDSFHAFLANGTVFSNCVSHSEKNANMLSYSCEIQFGEPDEVTGNIEIAPEISATGLLHGAFSTEVYYWFRGYDTDGWTCPESSRVAMKMGGLVPRMKLEGVDVDFTKYSGRNAGRFGSRRPPQDIADALDNNLVRQATNIRSRDERRDFLFNGYGLHTCGSEGFSKQRDQYGLSRVTTRWAHAMAFMAVDDRPWAHQAYGGSIELVMNSWAIWNSGPRDIHDSGAYANRIAEIVAGDKGLTKESVLKWMQAIDLVNPQTGNLLIPKGSFWARSKDLDNRQVIAKSSINGWKRKSVPWGFEGLI